MRRKFHGLLLLTSTSFLAAVWMACGAAPSIAGVSDEARIAPPAAPAAAAPAAAPAVDAADAADADTTPDAGMLRYPDISATHIAFVYADDLWTVPRDGGQAAPLASPPGPELFPRFSPDGKTLAFVGNYDGNRDVYTVGVAGGLSTRVTHHPMPEQLCDWTPDGRSLVFASGHAAPLTGRQPQLFTVPAEGGLPVKLPVPYGGNGALSPDGRWLAYVPVPFDFRTWKRYEGGTAMDIWLFDLVDHKSRRMTDWAGTDTQPMWHGNTVYYLSDASPNHFLNIWSFDTVSGARQQSTDLGDYDIRWPAIGPGPDGSGEIVFQHGSALKVLDLKTRNVRTVPVTIPGDRPKLRPRTVDVAGAAQDWSLSPSGKRALCEARCDIWTLGAENGSPRNLTATAGASERDPAWSPDGEWVAYLSDADGEYELWMRPSDGKGNPRQLTDGHKAFFFEPQWSPDSARLAFLDQLGTVYVHDVKAGTTVEVDKDPWAGAPELSWSHDGSWLAYTKAGDNMLTSIWLYDTATGGKTQLTGGVFRDTSPCFDREGKYLYFASARDLSAPIYEDLGTTFVYAGTQRLLLVPLRADVPSPWLPESDEEPYGAAKDKLEKEQAGKDKARKDDDKDSGKDGAGKDGDNGGKPGDKADKKDGDKGDDATAADDKTPAGDGKPAAETPKERLKIDTQGFERRAVLLPIKRGGFGGLMVNHDGKLIYARGAAPGSEDPPSIRLFDPSAKDKEGQEEKVLADKAQEFSLSADGRKLLVVADGAVTIRDASPDSKAKPVATAGMTVTVDPRAEWKEIYVDAWRRFRDWFYDPNMHGVDWERMRRRYEVMLADCVSREDVSYVIRELISELNVGHAYYNVGEVDEEPKTSVGLLGADFALEDGAYRIAAIYEGGAWDADARGPLSQPGVNVKVGDWLLAVDGVPLDTKQDPWAAFQGKADRVVTLTVSDKPTLQPVAASGAPGGGATGDAHSGDAHAAGDSHADAHGAAPVTTGQRDVLVKPVGSESDLRYRAWIERNRQHVAERSGGRVGYLHVPDTGVNGQNNLFRQFYGQIAAPALIVDERWNGGGQIPTRFIELLHRPATNMWSTRGSKPVIWPPDSHQGPLCMLINQRAGSGGDAFPYYFREAGLGPLIGVRTWGGLVGIGDLPRMLDGASVSVPNFAFYENDGTWGVEGHGVDPDIEVVDDPALMVDGGDPQLEKAIEVMLASLQDKPFIAPAPPAFPDRSGMGITPADH